MRRTLRALVLVLPLAACSSPATTEPAAAPTTNSPSAAAAPTAAPATAATGTTAAADSTVTATLAPVATVAVTPAPTEQIPAALAFGATLVGGGSIDLAEYAGKPVAFWFWAPT